MTHARRHARRVLLVVVPWALLACGARTGLRVDDAPSPPRDLGVDASRDFGVDMQRDLGVDMPSDLGADMPSDLGVDMPPPPNGCADGRRDAFRDEVHYPDIAGCAGGWDHPGVVIASLPTCGNGGDDGPNPAGAGCDVADLCAAGWHVCRDPADVARSSPDGCAGVGDVGGVAFFVTRASGPGCGVCATGTATDCTGSDCRHGCAMTSRTTNDLFGCGTVGDAPDPSACAPIDRFSNNVCDALPSPWFCTDDGSGTHEADTVVKRGPEAGGALCCRGE